LSKSEALTFDTWVAVELDESGPFTALVVLMAIGELSVTPLRSTWFHVIGDELDWAEVGRMLDGGGQDWDGVVFAPRTRADDGGPLSDAAARIALKDLGQSIVADRRVLNTEHFFDRLGRRMKVEEVLVQ